VDHDRSHKLYGYNTLLISYLGQTEQSDIGRGRSLRLSAYVLRILRLIRGGYGVYLCYAHYPGVIHADSLEPLATTGIDIKYKINIGNKKVKKDRWPMKSQTAAFQDGSGGLSLGKFADSPRIRVVLIPG
jgi:hypothetical protein